jgi:hypothetical protein
MKRPPFPDAHGGTLVLALVMTALLAFVAAQTLRRVGPKLQQAAQVAAWQEARLAAEGGIDVAMSELMRNATGSANGSWPGWKQDDGGRIVPVLAGTLDLVDSILSLLGSSVTVSKPIFLDNQVIATGSGPASEVDVQLWAVYPTGNPYHRWFRIRSMATSAVSGPSYTVVDKLDASLRRLSLRTVRPQLKKDDVGLPMSLPTPNASRIVEVLVEPVLCFELAILTDRALSLGTSGSWSVDSYDSRDRMKSNSDGTYPGRRSPKVQENGSIASNLGRPGDALFGPLIACNGARVRGVVATNGGDDPGTAEQENLSGHGGVDPARVRDDFYREMKPPIRPTSGIMLPRPLLGLPFLAGTESSPTKYLITGNLGEFRVAAPPEGVKGGIIILVNGNLEVARGTITIPPNVTAQIYVRGNVDFHNNAINLAPSSSKRPGQLQVYGEAGDSERRTVRAYGDAMICAAFYGPAYEVMLTDNVQWYGAIGARSFEMLGGGSGGFHYDEALGSVGLPIGFRIVRYVEDVRE